MRRSHRARPGSGQTELQMGPLIDMVFLLLTYFLFTISLTTVEGLLPSRLAVGNDQQQQERQPDETKQVVVRIVQTGSEVQFFVDDWPVESYERVVEHLTSLPKDSMVVIDAGPNVVYDNVVRLYNECLKLSIEKVVFPLMSGSTSGAGSAPAAAPAGAPAAVPAGESQSPPAAAPAEAPARAPRS